VHPLWGSAPPSMATVTIRDGQFLTGRAVGSWRLAVGGWRLAVGGWRYAT
jgi:hypothetical protein